VLPELFWGRNLEGGEKSKKMQGALKKTSGRSYSLERPVARHFVWYSYSTCYAFGKLLKIQRSTPGYSVGFALGEQDLRLSRQRKRWARRL
jgi:hypothetical protein